MTLMQVIAWIQQVGQQLGAQKIADLLPLITKLIAAAKTGDWTAIAAVVLEIVNLFIKTPVPPPTPQPVTFASAGQEQAEAVKELVAMGVPHADAEDFVKALA